mmetsp:Transcript_157027/g.273454  ORF Transcript_157027/g.273454 Transcript_157027/m.273454 type:complete len:333 (+) Transcript_157027:73-1071(+)
MCKKLFLWACLVCIVSGHGMLRARTQFQVHSYKEDRSHQTWKPREQLLLMQRRVGSYRSLRALATLLLAVEKAAAWHVTGPLHVNSGQSAGSRCISSHKHGPSLLLPLTRAPCHPVMKVVQYGSGPGQYDIVKFLRVAKKGIYKSLEEEDGILNEDALTTLKVLNEQNPCYPKPTADNDMWSGKWRLMTSVLACDGMRQHLPSSVIVEEDGNLTLESTVSFGPSEVQALLQLTGSVSAKTDNDLLLRIQKLTLTLKEGDKEKVAELAPTVTECAKENFGIKLVQDEEAAAWHGELPMPKTPLTIEYLDQDFHVMEKFRDNWIVLSKEGVERD